MGELDLAGRRGRLALLELQRTGGELEVGAAEANGAGRHQHDLAAALVQAGDIAGQCLQPLAADLPLALVDQDRRADLHDQPLGAGQGHHAASRVESRCRSTSFISSCSSGCTPWPDTPEITCPLLRLALAGAARLASISSPVMASVLLSATISFLRARLPP